MSEHTRGPWEVGQYPWLIDDNAGDEVAQVSSSRIEYAANARLIAAAPDLLAACKKALHLVEENNEAIVEMVGSFGLYADLHNAIRKAEGGAP